MKLDENFEFLGNSDKFYIRNYNEEKIVFLEK